jgi:hypothetical protein
MHRRQRQSLKQQIGSRSIMRQSDLLLEVNCDWLRVFSIFQALSVSGLWRRRCPLAASHMDGAVHSSAIPDAAGALRCLLPAKLLFDFHACGRALTSSRSERCLGTTRQELRLALRCPSAPCSRECCREPPSLPLPPPKSPSSHRKGNGHYACR